MDQQAKPTPPSVDKIGDGLAALEVARDKRRIYLQRKADFLAAEQQYHAAVAYCRQLAQEAAEHEAAYA